MLILVIISTYFRSHSDCYLGHSTNFQEMHDLSQMFLKKLLKIPQLMCSNDTNQILDADH